MLKKQEYHTGDVGEGGISVTDVVFLPVWIRIVCVSVGLCDWLKGLKRGTRQGKPPRCSFRAVPIGRLRLERVYPRLTNS
jgi:hypothetical protein